jgi:hypothetical protein
MCESARHAHQRALPTTGSATRQAGGYVPGRVLFPSRSGDFSMDWLAGSIDVAWGSASLLVAWEA